MKKETKMATKLQATSTAIIGKDTIYICQNETCNSREKEFALVDRQYKYCSKCGSISIKSTLCDSYKHVPALIEAENIDEEEDFNE
jgi:hypothetical protein